MLNVVVLVSGGGTNLQAIIDAIESGTITNTKITGVISNNKKSYALERARNHGIENLCISPKDYETRAVFNEKSLEAVEGMNPDLIVRAGFLVVIPPKMIEKYRSTREKKDAMTLLSNWEKIDSRRYGIIINLFEDESPIKQEDKIFVKSIDYIKGMEGEKCLFILTNDLAAHLFNNNTETNKTKNKLYVALTRSLNELSIYILKEVEDKYTKKRIQDFFERYL